MNITKYSKHLKNLGTYFGASIIPMILGLVTNPWIAKNMGPNDYAISGYYTSFNALLQPIIVFYMVHYFIKEFYRLDEVGRKYLFAVIAKSLMWFSGIISILCFCGVLCYILLFNSDSTLPINPYLAMTVFSIPLCGLYNLIQARHRIDRQASAFFKLTTITGVISVVLSLLFVVFLKWGAFGKLLAPLLTNFLNFIFLFCKYHKSIFIHTDVKDYIKIFKFCWPLAISAMLGYFTNGFDRTYLETLGDNTTYGYYVVGASIAAYLSTFSTAVSNTFTPDLYQSVIQKQWSKYFKFVAIDLGCISLIVIIFIIFAPMIINILTAGRYTASTPYSQIIALSTLTSAIYFIINNFTITINKPKLYLLTSITGSIAIVVGMPIIVRNFGFFGGAWMTVLSFVGFAIINIAFLIFFSKFSFNNK